MVLQIKWGNGLTIINMVSKLSNWRGRQTVLEIDGFSLSGQVIDHPAVRRNGTLDICSTYAFKSANGEIIQVTRRGTYNRVHAEPMNGGPRKLVMVMSTYSPKPYTPKGGALVNVQNGREIQTC